MTEQELKKFAAEVIKDFQESEREKDDKVVEEDEKSYKQFGGYMKRYEDEKEVAKKKEDEMSKDNEDDDEDDKDKKDNEDDEKKKKTDVSNPVKSYEELGVVQQTADNGDVFKIDFTDLENGKPKIDLIKQKMGSNTFFDSGSGAGEKMHKGIKLSDVLQHAEAKDHEAITKNFSEYTDEDNKIAKDIYNDIETGTQTVNGIEIPLTENQKVAIRMSRQCIS